MKKECHDVLLQEWNINKENMFDEAYDFVHEMVASPLKIDALRKVHEEVFASVDCLRCANCCKTTPAILTKKDAKRIAAHLKMPPKTFIRKYTITDVDGEMVMNGVPCTFLDDDNSCTIYESRPEACRRFPHTDEDAFYKRPRLNANNTQVCPAAYHIVKTLKTMEI